MAETVAVPLHGWQTGMHPRASGMRIVSIGRVYLELGEALRVEMVDSGPGAGLVHLQYYIVTPAGPWALWRSCRTEEAGECEAALRELAAPFSEAMGD